MNLKLLQAITLAAMVGTETTRPDTPVEDANEDFNAHLKRCQQCANNPFSLCVTGERLIQEAANKLQTK